MLSFKQFIFEDDYRGQHTAPDKESGSPLHDVTANGVYPKDFYSHKGFRYYADYGGAHDRTVYNKICNMKDKPDEKVYAYRAIPTEVYEAALKKDTPLKHMIRPGDWVSISKEYAKQHGQAHLGGKGKYKIAAMRVPARHLYTAGDSHHEWGYDPS